MKKIILVAVDSNFGIGNKGTLPWQGQQRADMKRFVHLTMGFPIIMGRKTYESFPKRPLVGRTNIVLTRQPLCIAPEYVSVGSLEEAFWAAEMEKKEKVFIIGGAEIYQQALSQADELEMTMIYHSYEVDTLFRFDPLLWEKVKTEHYPADEQNKQAYSFLTYKRFQI